MRRRTRRSPAPMPRRREPIVVAKTAQRPAISIGLVVLMALALLLALVLPALANARPAAKLAAAPAVELAGSVARIHVETQADAPVAIEWGLAPNADRVVRSPAGTSHDLHLSGLEPGRLYVYRVVVDGVAVGAPVPFRTEGPVVVPAKAVTGGAGAALQI